MKAIQIRPKLISGWSGLRGTAVNFDAGSLENIASGLLLRQAAKEITEGTGRRPPAGSNCRSRADRAAPFPGQ